ncbi:MAG: hypothetical protein ACPIOQ_79345, partial [Promethearchaeia archaeon]
RVTAGQPEVWAGIQDRVNASTDCIAVRQLRPVPRSYADAIKGASESKRKTYRALVWTSAAARVEDIARVNTLTPLVLQQKTPVRVLHRRSLATRARTVTFMQVRKDKSVVFVFVVCVWRFNTHCGCAAAARQGLWGTATMLQWQRVNACLHLAAMRRDLRAFSLIFGHGAFCSLSA